MVSDGTKILTPKGFRRIEDLKIGDLVFNYWGDPVKILEIMRSIPDHFMPSYFVEFDRGEELWVDGKQEWLVYTQDELGRFDSTYKMTRDLFVEMKTEKEIHYGPYHNITNIKGTHANCSHRRTLRVDADNPCFLVGNTLIPVNGV